MDQETKNEIWTARVKIVLGRFIIVPFEFAFGYLIFALIVLRFTFSNDETAAMIFSLTGLFIAFMLFFIFFFVDFKPKWTQIQAFTEHLVLYKQKAKEASVPQDAIYVMSFTQDDQGDLKKHIVYQAWKNNEDIVLFPEKPSIEYLKRYIEKKVAYVLITLTKIKSLEVKPSGTQTFTDIIYESKKIKEVQKSIETVTLINSDQKVFCFDSRIMTLLEQPISPKGSKPSIIEDQTHDVETKLKQLKEWVEKGLITQEEYQTQRQKILDRM